ncbi:MAG: hypothetical protein EKK64_06580 [Neisseriaceae bacterium]|nr:MAG: hypothetical protein EKK64_06580 [Neisseriaceae bacterium]
MTNNKTYHENGGWYFKKNGCLTLSVGNPSHPQIIWDNGTKEWHLYGVLHRAGKPAIEYSNGDVEYWFNGKRHRTDGPAVIYRNKQYWFVNGEFQKCTH